MEDQETTTAPVEEQVAAPEVVETEQTSEQATEQAEDFAWYKKLSPETQQAIKEGGETWDRQINKNNQQYVEKRKQYEKLLEETKVEKPQPRNDVNAVKSVIKQKVKDGEITSDYADALLKEIEQELVKPPLEDQIRPVIDKYLEEVFKMQTIQKFQEELVIASKGQLDNDGAFAMLNGFISMGIPLPEALDKAKKIFKTVETDTVKKEVKEIMKPSNTKILTPETALSSTVTDDDILERVKAKALADAKGGG